MAKVRIYLDNVAQPVEIETERRAAMQLVNQFGRKLEGVDVRNRIRVTDLTGHESFGALDLDKVTFVYAEMGDDL